MRTPIRIGLPVLAVLLASCDTKTTAIKDGDTNAPSFEDYEPDADNDGDGWTVTDGDCADDDPAVYPGADEDCNGIDDNCNGAVDEGFPDADADGTPDCQGDVEECDGVDNDGDGEIDEGFDADGDGVPDCDPVEECNGVDDDGDGEIDEGFDADGDGYTECGDDTTAPDCDDSDAAIHPGASEVGEDLVDNDCDGLVDEGGWAEGDLYVTEVMQNPGAVPDVAGEWFEIVNGSDHTIVLNGVLIYSSLDADWHQIASDDLLLIEPGEFFVLGNDDDVLTNGGVEVDYRYEDVALSNESDEIILEADGIVLDVVSWDDGVVWPDPDGASMTLDPTYSSPLDNDDGIYWCEATTRWSTATDRGTPGWENQFCWPTASADYDDSVALETCNTLTLDGSGSADPTGLTLTYEWELTSAPSGSGKTTADIEDPTDMMPTFSADVAGAYTFTLTVFNGTEYSPPDSLTLTFTDRGWNNDPIAEAGDDQTWSEDASCTPISYGVSYDCNDCSARSFDLDGGDSYDPDGDWIDDPSWTVLSDTSAGATLTDEDTWTPTVSVPGPTASYGVATDVSVVLQLEVTDCMGATGTDTVTVTHSCTGI